ncbi:MAG: hypothetical protein ABH873_04535 [Candidatus Firestonebacteria bacterium]
MNKIFSILYSAGFIIALIYTYGNYNKNFSTLGKIIFIILGAIIVLGSIWNIYRIFKNK